MLTPKDGPPVQVDLPIGATRPLHLTVARGVADVLPLGRVTLSTDFPLGLWRGWAYVHFPLTANVYPAPEASPPPLPPGHRGSDAHRSERAAEAELSGLRDYQRGDPQHRIAWKAVARGAGWYTKQFEGAGGSGAIELDWADLPRDSMSRRDYRVSPHGFSPPSARPVHSPCGCPGTRLAARPGRRAPARGAYRALACSAPSSRHADVR